MQKRNSLFRWAMSIASGLVLAVASVVAATPCGVVYYQPETPKNIAERIAAQKK